MAAPVLQPRQHPWYRDRFYTIHGHQLPSVTTILEVIAKPALGPWYAKEERRYFETAMLEVLTQSGARDPEYVLSAVAAAVTAGKGAEGGAPEARAVGAGGPAGRGGEARPPAGG